MDPVTPDNTRDSDPLASLAAAMNYTHIIVDTHEKVSAMIDDIADLPLSPPSLYADIEGVELGRYGSISIIELLASPLNIVYLIDVHILQEDAFFTPGLKRTLNLKSILESPTIPKVFFDLRNDSDALFSLFHISIACIHDIQVMEIASRPDKYSHRLSSLRKCIERDAGMDPEQLAAWSACKGVPGGRYETFNHRPIREDVVEYCVNDVLFLPKLWKVYDGWIDFVKEPKWEHTYQEARTWRGRIEKEVRDRITLSQSADFNPKADSDIKTRAPWPWRYAKAYTPTSDPDGPPLPPTDEPLGWVNEEYDPHWEAEQQRREEFERNNPQEDFSTPVKDPPEWAQTPSSSAVPGTADSGVGTGVSSFLSKLKRTRTTGNTPEPEDYWKRGGGKADQEGGWRDENDDMESSAAPSRTMTAGDGSPRPRERGLRRKVSELKGKVEKRLRK